MSQSVGVAYFRLVSILVRTYYSGDSFVHRCSAKVKVALFAAYSLMLFFIQAWTGLLIAAILLVFVLFASKTSFRRAWMLLLPVLLLAAITIAVNGFTLDVGSASLRSAGLGGVSAGVFAALEPVRFVGDFGWYPAGFAQGCFYAVRIILLMAASFLLCFTTTSIALTNALGGFLKPLSRLGVPVDDVATIFALALRFIPVTAEEMERVRSAQLSRGASFDAGSLRGRLHAWRAVLLPMLVGMLRRSDVLAHAMNARCYGIPGVERTSLRVEAVTGRSACILVVGLALIFAIALVF